MEKQLFDWKDWDQQDTAAFVFTECVLKQDIGEHKQGAKISCILVDYQQGSMQFCNDTGEDVIATFNLTLAVGSQH